jgi:hypothetical protein
VLAPVRAGETIVPVRGLAVADGVCEFSQGDRRFSVKVG